MTASDLSLVVVVTGAAGKRQDDRRTIEFETESGEPDEVVRQVLALCE